MKVFLHETRDPDHDPNKHYEKPPSSFSSLRLLPNDGNKRRHDIPIPYKVSLISESESYKKI